MINSDYFSRVPELKNEKKMLQIKSQHYSSINSTMEGTLYSSFFVFFVPTIENGQKLCIQVCFGFFLAKSGTTIKVLSVVIRMTIKNLKQFTRC